MKQKKYDYGECEVCNAPRVGKHIKQDFWIKGKLIVVENVPAGVCPRCGSKVVEAKVGIWLANLIRQSDRISKAPKMAVPTIKFDPTEVAA